MDLKGENENMETEKRSGRRRERDARKSVKKGGTRERNNKRKNNAFPYPLTTI